MDVLNSFGGGRVGPSVYDVYVEVRTALNQPVLSKEAWIASLGGGGSAVGSGGVVSADYDDATGIMTLTFTDGTTLATGDLRGKGTPGDDGVGITSTRYDPSTGRITLAFSDGTSHQTGDLRGAPGEDGRGITSASYDPVTGRITLGFSDNTSSQTGDLRGKAGASMTVRPFTDRAAFEAYQSTSDLEWVVLNIAQA